MLTFTEDTAVSFPVDFLVDGVHVVPTSATVTVRDETGATIAGLVDAPLDVSSTHTLVSVPGTDNAVPLGSDYVNRYLQVTFLHEGRTHQRHFVYRVRPFIPIAVTPDDVRAELGLDSREMPDDVIDLYGAYLDLKADYDMETALITGTQAALAANRAIAVKAALEMIDSLVFRVAIKMRSEDSALERMTSFDPDKIRIRLGQKLGRLLDVIAGDTTEGSAVLILATPTDAITGE